MTYSKDAELVNDNSRISQRNISINAGGGWWRAAGGRRRAGGSTINEGGRPSLTLVVMKAASLDAASTKLEFFIESVLSR